MGAIRGFAGWLLRLSVVTGCLTGAGVFLGPSDSGLATPPNCSVCKELR